MTCGPEHDPDNDHGAARAMAYARRVLTSTTAPDPIGTDSGKVRAVTRSSALRQVAGRRQAACRELFRCELEPGVSDQIRRATKGSFVLGNERFASEVEAVIRRSVSPGKLVWSARTCFRGAAWCDTAFRRSAGGRPGKKAAPAAEVMR